MEHNWKAEFLNIIPFFGHRNWILVVDKAFPLQSKQGITILNSGEEMKEVLGYVLDKITGQQHIRPKVYVDKELQELKESYCSGISALRNQIMNIIDEKTDDSVSQILHDAVFSKIKDVCQLFDVMVIKTETFIPYTSVFIELECGYWRQEQEKRLRNDM